MQGRTNTRADVFAGSAAIILYSNRSLYQDLLREDFLRHFYSLVKKNGRIAAS